MCARAMTRGPSATTQNTAREAADGVGSTRFDAFVSYSHGDRPVAAGIQTGLQRIARRMGRLNALRVFRDDTDLTAVEDRLAVEELLALLEPRERTIVYLRFFEGLTQSEIAAQVGISQMHVSRMLSRSLELLAEHVHAAADS